MQLALINDKTYKKGVNNVGDVVGIYGDSHIFTAVEKNIFTIVQDSRTKTVLDASIQSTIPEIKQLTRAKTTDWTENRPEEKQVWKSLDGEFRNIVKDPKYKICYENGSLKETYSKYPENLATIQPIADIK